MKFFEIVRFSNFFCLIFKRKKKFRTQSFQKKNFRTPNILFSNDFKHQKCEETPNFIARKIASDQTHNVLIPPPPTPF